MGDKNDPFDWVVGEIAAKQHGVVSLRQLIDSGITRNGVSKRVRKGQLQRLHQGVYAVGHRPVSRRGFWMAAVLAGGEGAALSHRSAAELWELLRPQAGPIHVSTFARSGRAKRVGIRLHRCPSLVAGTTTKRLRIPVTTPARTIDDLRGTVPSRQWRRAVRQAELVATDSAPRSQPTAPAATWRETSCGSVAAPGCRRRK